MFLLRDHCKGQKHVKKALQKKMQLRKEAKAKGKQEGEGSQDSQGPKLRTLFQELEMTSEAVVGLEFITEFSTGDEREAPLYHCSMEECREEQGDAETKNILSLSLQSDRLLPPHSDGGTTARSECRRTERLTG